MDLKQTYNRIAQDWYRDHQADDWWVTGTEKLCSLLPQGASLLDVGCGAGIKSQYLASKGLAVTGIDFSEEFIKIAQKENPKISFHVLDLYDLDSLPQEFDAVFAQAVLLHIPKNDVPMIFEKLARKVKNGGYLYVAVKERRLDQPDEEIREESDYGYTYERFFSYFSPEEVQNYFTQTGFQVVYASVNLSGKTNWIQMIGQKD